jgi:peptidyl-prolyl cis-trans isomerase D
MLQQIRDKITGWFAIVFLGAIAVVFIFWGIQFESTVNVAAATVNGEKVPVEAVSRAWQNRHTELQQALRDEVPPEMIKVEQQRLLDQFVRRELLKQRAEAFGYRVSDRELAEAIAAVPELQVDGAFSRDRYAALLRAQGRSEADFEADYRLDLEIGQIQNAVMGSAFTLPGEIKRRVALQGEARETQMLLLPAANYAAGVTVTPEQVAARYERDKAKLLTQESANVQYLQLNLADVAATVQVSDEALRAFYDQVAAERYTTTERRQARHILIETGSDEAAAKARAEKLAAEAKAGADFAALATQNSDDPGSKGQGGDLGWATRDSFVAPFADALFAMQPGQISDPVKTQFGYHIIKLEAVEPGAQRPFEDVRAELEADYRREQAQSLFYERSQQLADESFAALSELESVATKLGLPLQTVDGFTRQGGGALGADRKLIDAVFSDEVLQERQNSPALDVGGDKVIVLRVTDYKPAAQRALDEVRAEIETTLRAEAATAAAEAAGRKAAEKLAAGTPMAEVAKEFNAQAATAPMMVVRNQEGFPPELSKALFAVAPPAAGGVTAGSATMGNGNVAAFVVTKIVPGTLPSDPAQSAQVKLEAGQREAIAEFTAYVTELERTAKVTRNETLFEQ